MIGEYQFGIASLLNKKELLQEGDPVNFQVRKGSRENEKWDSAGFITFF